MAQQQDTKIRWYTFDAETVLEELHTDPQQGLSAAEAAQRRATYGDNELPRKKKVPALVSFLKQFNNILIYILLLAAVITFLLGHLTDTIVIILVTMINALIGFIQESKAEKALDNIKNMLSLTAQVIRDGERMEIDARELTPGDIVVLQPGDKVPADLRLIRTSNLQVEESVLTGESVPSEKTQRLWKRILP